MTSQIAFERFRKDVENNGFPEHILDREEDTGFVDQIVSDYEKRYGRTVVHIEEYKKVEEYEIQKGRESGRKRYIIDEIDE